MIDAWMKWDVPFTQRLAERLVPLRIDWTEEPLVAGRLGRLRQALAQSCPIPIAGGEHEFTAAAFAELMERRLHHILQPDVCWCGGMTGACQNIRLGERPRRGVRVCPHRGAEIWGLHALAALDKHPLAESGRPWMIWVGGQPPIQNGLIEVPAGPGFGAVFDEL